MPRLRPKALCLLVCLLLAPLLPPSTAQARTASTTFSVGIRIVPHATTSAQPAARSKAIKVGAPETSSTKIGSGKNG